MRYFEILEDTLMFHRIASFSKSETRRLVQHPRCIMFDNGVLNALLGNFNILLDRVGFLFENLFISQLISFIETHQKRWRISSYRIENSAEVDLVLEMENETWAIELKASENVGKSDLRGLKSFAEYYGRPHRSFIAYMGAHLRQIDETVIWPWKNLLRELQKYI